MKNKNARHSLGTKEGERSLYTGEFVRTGIKHGYMGNVVTVLFKDVRDEADHINY
jgi:hypothetical protein